MSRSPVMAASWSCERRLLVVVQEYPHQLRRESFFLISNLPRKCLGGWVLRHCYKRRGTTEACFGELKSGFGASMPTTTRLVARDAEAFERAQVLLRLRLRAYERVHFARAQLKRTTRQGGSVRGVRQRLLKVAARLVRGGRPLRFRASHRVHARWSRLLPPRQLA